MISNKEIGFQLGFPYDESKWTAKQWSAIYKIKDLEEELDELNLKYSIDFDEEVESLIEITTDKLYDLYDKYDDVFNQN